MFDYVRKWVKKPKSHTFWLWNFWEVKVEIRIFIVHYVHCLFDKNSENSHFSTFTHLAGSGRNHDISSEMSALGLSKASWNNGSLQERISWRFSYLWKKSIFFEFKIWLKKWKSQILQRIRVRIKWLFRSRILPYSPPKTP